MGQLHIEFWGRAPDWEMGTFFKMQNWELESNNNLFFNILYFMQVSFELLHFFTFIWCMVPMNQCMPVSSIIMYVYVFSTFFFKHNTTYFLRVNACRVFNFIVPYIQYNLGGHKLMTIVKIGVWRGVQSRFYSLDNVWKK